MGKKQKRHRAVWPAAIVEELEAYLDSEVAFVNPDTKAEVERKIHDVDEEISQHLNEEYEDGDYSPEPLRRFSSTQVRDKLRRMYESRGRKESHGRDWKIIYRRGSSCLMSSEGPERVDRVARRSGAIKVKWMERYLRSPRKTRAGSHPRRECHPSRRSSNAATSSSPIDSSRLRGQKVAVKHLLILKYKASNHENKPDPSSISSQQSIAFPVKGQAAEFEIAVPHVDNSILKRTLFHQNSRLSVSPELELHSTPSEILASFSDCDDTGDVNISGTTTSLDLSEQLSRLENELNELRALRDETALEIDFWKAKYCTVNDEIADLKRENNALVVKMGALIRTGDQLTVNDFRKSQEMIDSLVEEIFRQRRFQSLERRVSMNVEKQTISGISKLMHDIGFRLEVILKGGHFAPLSVLPQLPPEQPLRALFKQAFGFDWDSNKTSKFLEQCCWHSDMQQCSILALGGVSLAQWVFNSSQADLVFDRFQNVNSQSSTNCYRRAINIVARRYPEFARAIDIDVHTKIAEDTLFEHFRKRKARALALKLQEALAPLWKGDPDGNGGLDAGIDNNQDITEQLTTVFDKALDVQCRLVLTGQQYECVWYAPGDLFDESTMTPYKIEGAVGADKPTIRLTLLPGISHVVDSKVRIDFGGFADSRRWPQGRAICLVPPLVWRECAELH